MADGRALQKERMHHRSILRDLCASGLAVFLCTLSTDALPIRLDTAPYITPHTSIAGNPPNQGVPAVYGWLHDLIHAYNAANQPDLPALATAPSVDSSASGNITEMTITVRGYQYLTVHWGGPQKNPNNDHTQAWYLGGALENFQLVAPVFRGKQYGLSGYRLWNPVPVTRVPDGGGTVTLLGMGLLGLWACSRQARAFKKRLV